MSRQSGERFAEEQGPELEGTESVQEAMEGQELEDLAVPRWRRSRGSLLVVLVAVVAGAGLYLMRATQGDLKASAQSRTVEAKVEEALAKLTGKGGGAGGAGGSLSLLFKDTEAILSRFQHDPAQRQVPVEFLKKDPFVEVGVLSGEREETAAMDAAKRSRLRREVQGLRLETVMQGARPLAIINGEIVGVGQKIGSFTVCGISGLAVELEAEGQRFTLSMEEAEGKRGGVQPMR